MMTTDTVPMITVTQAAQRLRRGYRPTVDLVLRGHLVGEQDPVTGRWSIDSSSVDAFLARSQPVALR